MHIWLSTHLLQENHRENNLMLIFLILQLYISYYYFILILYFPRFFPIRDLLILFFVSSDTILFLSFSLVSSEHLCFICEILCFSLVSLETTLFLLALPILIFVSSEQCFPKLGLFSPDIKILISFLRSSEYFLPLFEGLAPRGRVAGPLLARPATHSISGSAARPPWSSR